jgi:hypothetical protein
MPVPMEPVINVMSLCTRVRDMFKACFDQRCISILGDSALAYGTALFYFSANYRNARDMLYVTTRNWHIWERWRMLYLPRLLEECKISYRGMIKTSNATSKLMCQANARTALRMAVAGGIDEFAHPNDKRLVRDGQFRLQCPPLDIHLDLISCAEHFYAIDDVDVAGDSLLLLTGVLGESLSLDHRRITPFLNGGRGQTPRLRQIALRAACRVLSYRCDSPCDADFSQAVLNAIYPSIKDERATVRNVIHLLHLEKWREGSDLALCSLPEIQLLVLLVLRAPKVDDPEIYISYCRALIRYMGADKQFPFRYSALRIVYGARQDLAMITATGVDEELRNMVLSELSPALLAAISSADHQVYHDPSYSTHLFHYISLIATLAKSPDWYPILIRDGHVKKCIALIDHSQFQSFQSSNFYLAEIFYRIASPSHAASSCDISFTDKQWWELMKDACIAVQLCDDSYLPVDDIPILAAVVSNTRIPLDLSKGELQSFEVCLSKALDRLRGRNPRPGENVISAVADLKKMVNDRWEVTVG